MTGNRYLRVTAGIRERYHAVQSRVRRASKVCAGLLEIDRARLERRKCARANFAYADGDVDGESIRNHRKVWRERFLQRVESTLPSKVIDSNATNPDFTSG